MKTLLFILSEYKRGPLLFSACLSFVYVVALLKQRFMWTEDGVDAVLEGVVAVCLIV